MEKFNENIQQLFNKAKNEPSPVTRQEAEAVVAAYKKGNTLSSFLGSIKGIILLVAAATALGLAYFAVQGVGNSGADSNGISQNASQGGVVAGAGKGSEITKSNKNEDPLNTTSGKTNNYEANENTIGKITVVGKMPTRHTNKGETINKNKVKTVNASEGSANSEPQNIPAAAEEKDPEVFVEPGIIKAIAQPEPEDAIVADSTISDEEEVDKKSSKEKDFVIAAPYFRRNFIKTDILGYFFNAYTAKRNSAFNIRPYFGDRITLGFERLITARVSAEITSVYGFPYQVFTGGSGSGATQYEQVHLYKGWMFHLGLRYYLLKGKQAGSGLYLGPSFSLGYLQERILYFDQSSAGKQGYTISTSKGKSGGYGVFAGYKFIYKNYFAEVTGAYVLHGYDDGYYNKAIFGQESIDRYTYLNRIEFSLGYSF